METACRAAIGGAETAAAQALKALAHPSWTPAVVATAAAMAADSTASICARGFLEQACTILKHQPILSSPVHQTHCRSKTCTVIVLRQVIMTTAAMAADNAVAACERGFPERAWHHRMPPLHDDALHADLSHLRSQVYVADLLDSACRLMTRPENLLIRSLQLTAVLMDILFSASLSFSGLYLGE